MNLLKSITVTQITKMVTVSSVRGRYVEMKDRQDYGLTFCISGQITYTHKGKKYISDNNHAIILPKGESYSLYGDKSGLFPVINFECTNFLCDTIVIIPIDNAEEYVKEYEKMQSLYLFDDNRLKVISIFYNMLHKLLTVHNSATLTPAIKYIENHYYDPKLSNSQLAEMCRISEVYFRKLFYEEYKITPKQFIIDLRLGKAKQLLADGGMKISVIAEKCGFSNPYHFCRMFKEKFALTPSEYMLKNRSYQI